MSGEPIPDGRAFEARLGGVAYLITIVAGMYAEAYVLGSIRGGDAARTLANIRGSEALYRSGVFADFAMIAAYLVVTAALYRLFKPVSPVVSLTAALFSLTGLALLSGAAALLVVPLHTQDASIAHEALWFHAAMFDLTNFFFGVYCALIGGLILRSGLMPRAVGWLMGLAGAVFLVDATLTLLAPAIARALPEGVMAISLIGEGSLALWLTAFGVRRTG